MSNKRRLRKNIGGGRVTMSELRMIRRSSTVGPFPTSRLIEFAIDGTASPQWAVRILKGYVGELRLAIGELLRTTELNLDEMEEDTRDAVALARSVFEKGGK